jgi:hypothetical protein
VGEPTAPGVLALVVVIPGRLPSSGVMAELREWRARSADGEENPRWFQGTGVVLHRAVADGTSSVCESVKAPAVPEGRVEAERGGRAAAMAIHAEGTSSKPLALLLRPSRMANAGRESVSIPSWMGVGVEVER